MERDGRARSGATLVVSILGYSEGEQDGVVAESEASVADLLQMCVLSNGKYFPMALFQHRSGGVTTRNGSVGIKIHVLGATKSKENYVHHAVFAAPEIIESGHDVPDIGTSVCCASYEKVAHGANTKVAISPNTPIKAPLDHERSEHRAKPNIDAFAPQFRVGDNVEARYNGESILPGGCSRYRFKRSAKPIRRPFFGWRNRGGHTAVLPSPCMDQRNNRFGE